jgi:hypothetical protein
VLGAAVAAVRIAQLFVVGRLHHVEQRRDRWIMHQRQIVPLIAVLRAERDRLGVAGPQHRTAARLDHRHGLGAVAQIGVPAAAVAIERAIVEPHQVHHHDRPLMLQLSKPSIFNKSTAMAGSWVAHDKSGHCSIAGVALVVGFESGTTAVKQ